MALRHAVELFAASGEDCAVVEQRLERWANDDQHVELAFLGRYLILELRSPRYASVGAARERQPFDAPRANCLHLHGLEGMDPEKERRAAASHHR